MAEFKWRNMNALWRMARIVFDDAQRTMLFENCIVPKKLFSLLPLKSTTCGYDEIVGLRKFLQGDTRTIELRIPTGRAVFIDDDLPNFDEFNDRLTALVEAVDPARIKEG